MNYNYLAGHDVLTAPLLENDSQDHEQLSDMKLKETQEQKIIQPQPKNESHYSPNYSTRNLSLGEIKLVKSVFADSLPLEKIFISNHIGFDFNPYSACSPAGTFIIHLGKEMFDNTAAYSESGRSAVIHQLVHYWQYLYSGKDNIESVIHDSCYDVSAMDYEAGRKWRHYTLEEQALLVQNWFDDGAREKDERFVYISEHIRTQKNK